MFKHLTRNLKLGLTTLTILTAGAGAAFAQTAQDDLVHYCDGQNFRDRVNCSSAIRNCIRNPFGDGCDTTLVGNAHTVAKVRYCSEQTVTEGHVCTETWARPNAASLVKSFITDDTPDGLASAPDITRRGQFLKGTADWLDTGEADVDKEGALYFDTATYEGAPLGGDATDGVAFFSSGYRDYYAGILSGTDLGAPLAQTMKVNWVGQVQTVNNYNTNTISKDFILEIDFDGGSNTGTIGAFVQRGTSDYYYHLTGTFDSKGVITGDVDFGGFRNSDRAKIRQSYESYRGQGKLTGLIGAEGAIGAFHSSNSRSFQHYSGGFIARPSTPKEIADFTAICVSDPFNPVCELRYKEERKAIINACITDGNANPTDCSVSALAKHPCITNPFTGICMTDFADYYETARTNRLNFCDNTANVANPVCIGDFRTDICDYDPFNAVCSFEGNPYDSDRASRLIDQCRDDTTGNAPCTTKFRDCTINPFGAGCDTALGEVHHNAMQIEFCGLHSNKVTETNRTCEAILKRVTTASWLQSFATELPTDIRSSGFVQASATRLNTGVLTPDRSISLNLADATFGGVKIGGDATDGVAFFYGWHGNRHSRSVGVLSGTDLGMPLRQTSGTAHWNGWFQVGYNLVITDFVLDINFDDKTIPGSEGAIEAFVHSYSDYYYHLNGSFNNKGVIKGTAIYSRFIDGDRINDTTGRIRRGTLTGLIGEEGAVGGFYKSGLYTGGFVASPNAGKVTYGQWLNSFDAPPPLKPVITSVTTSDGNSESTLENQFLQGTADGLEFGNIKKSTRGRGTDPDITILDLQVAEYDGSILGGDDTNAVAFFRGKIRGSEIYYYAGILSDTNLGAPVTQTQGEATWNGQIGSSNHGINGDFELTIDFGEEKVDGFAAKAGTNSGHKYLYLRGGFDDYGVIDGHTRYGVFANGTRPAIDDATVAFNGQLRGLIGQEGAVGAFISDSHVDGYSGGFVVENPDN